MEVTLDRDSDDERSRVASFLNFLQILFTNQKVCAKIIKQFRQTESKRIADEL